MNITKAQYQNDRLGNPSCIEATVDSITSFVPIDPENSDYTEIMKQVEAGELTIEPADE